MLETATPIRLLITMGDVAGVGPEIIVRAWPQLTQLCHPIVVGDCDWLQRAIHHVKSSAAPQRIHHPNEAIPRADVIPCLSVSSVSLTDVRPAQVSAAAGRAAYDFLCHAIDWALAGDVDGIVTAPLHKEGLHAAGLPYPGHTEILAERCGVKEFAMLLYVNGLGVAHVTLHVALRDVFRLLTLQAIVEKAQLLDRMMTRLLDRKPRIAVAALNPHASDGGLFGDEEETIIRPAVLSAQKLGLNVSGPWPADTLFVRAHHGDFDGVVAMYHDQGHIALKLLGEWRAVNVSAGLPIVRTSVAHGTAYDVAWKGEAQIESLLEATRVAAQLSRTKTETRETIR